MLPQFPPANEEAPYVIMIPYSPAPQSPFKARARHKPHTAMQNAAKQRRYAHPALFSPFQHQISPLHNPNQKPHHTTSPPKPPLHTPQTPQAPNHHGTNNRLNPTTSCRQQTHVPKLFIARLTLHSSHKLKHRHGHASTVRGADWQTTHCGPELPRPAAPVDHVEASGCPVWGDRGAVWRREMMSCSSRRASSSGESGPEVMPGSRKRVEVRRWALARFWAWA